MTPDELDRALATLGAGDALRTQARGLPGAANGIVAGPLRLPTVADYAAHVVRPLGADPATPPKPRRLHAPSRVPATYRATPHSLHVPLRARINERLWTAIEKLDPGDRYGMLLLGPSGCGKSTSAAYAVTRWYSRQPGATEWRDDETDVDWLDAIKATDAERRYKLGSGDPTSLKVACGTKWLVLDDVGLSTSATLVQLILAQRYASGLPTIVTSGLEKAQFVEHVGAATVRRIVEFEGRSRGVLVDCHPKKGKP